MEEKKQIEIPEDPIVVEKVTQAIELYFTKESREPTYKRK